MIKQLLKHKSTILLLLTVELIIAFVIYMNTQHDIDTFIDNKTKSAEIEYKAVYSKVKEQSEMVFQESINIPTIINSFKNAYLSNEKKQNIIRDKLYNDLLPSYQRLNKLIHLRIIHFILPDNKSFLRVHKPSKFGDDLTGVRATVEYVNRYKKPINGFEEGRVKNGFRFVYPLFDDTNKYLGSVDLSFSIRSFSHVLDNEMHSSKFIILKSIVDKKVWKENTILNYHESGISSLFLIDKSQFIGKDIKEIEKFKNKVTTQLKSSFSKNILKEDSFSLPLSLKDTTHLLTFLPIKNPVSEKIVSYIILNSQSSVLNEINTEFWILQSISLILILTLFAFLYRNQQEHILLIKSESKYTNVIENIKEHYFFYSHGIDGVFTYVSNSITDVLGYTKEEFMKHYESYLTDEPMNNLVEESTNKTINGETQEPYILSIYHKNGTIKYLEISEYRLDDSDGEFISLNGVARDITQEYNRTKEIENLKEQMELALLGNNDGIWDWNLLTNEVYYSPRWKEMLGYSDDELPNDFSIWENRVNKDDKPKVLADIQTHIEGKSSYVDNKHRIKHKDGHWVWIHNRATAIFDEQGKAIRLIGTHTDITAEKEIQSLSQERGLILENSLNEIYIFDSKSFKFLYINKGAQNNIGYSTEEILEMTPLDIKPYITEDEFINILQPIIKQEEQYVQFQTVHRRKDTTEYNVDIYVQSSIYEGHNAYVAIILDITKRKKIELELEEQHKYLQSIIDGVDDPIMVIKEDYSVEVMNEKIKKSLKSIKIADLDSPKCYEISHHRSTPCDGSEHPCPLKDVLATKKHTTVVHNHDTLDGDNRYIELSASPLFDKDENCIGIIESARDITGHLRIQDELREQKSILDHQAHHDALTELPNRVLFNDRLEQAIQTAKRNKTNVALLFIDLDHFKEINDSLGHAVGDEILKTVSKRLRGVIREEDTVSRLGGDEFTVILEELSQAQDASLIASKILEVLSKSMNVNDNVLYVSSSIGISIYPEDGVSTQNLLKYADSAMYKAKDEGRNNFQYYNSVMTELAFERVVMETSLREALEKEQFVIYYQPQVDGTTDKLIGMEALIRWQHPTMGLVPPNKFIPLAESTGLIVELDRYVMKTAMTQVSQWYKDGLNPGVLAMNLAVKQLKQTDFIEIIENLMKETECKAQWMALEVTEGQIMTNPDEAIKQLTQISDLGIDLAVDDFGTGYSSLAYLKRLPIDKLKIDQAFVRNLPDDEEDAGITRAVIALAKSLNLSVIAEGVETKEQKDFIVKNGCENIQGYYYSKPVPNNEFEVILKNGFKS